MIVFARMVLMWNSAGAAATPTPKKKVSLILQNLRSPFCSVCMRGVDTQKDIANSAEFVTLFFFDVATGNFKTYVNPDFLGSQISGVVHTDVCC